MKDILGIYSAPPRHWVGDGFPVRSLFSYNSHAEHVSPFLLLDHAGPMDFPAAERPRGVGEHPHRGFETVTIVYQGEVEHLDSTGAGGLIGPGDVQWMTAGAGIIHQEFHSTAFTKRGGTIEMAQLWVNLPAASKMTPPGYQTLLDADIPVVSLPDAGGTLRVIAGEYDGRRGPAHTHTPMGVWDLRFAQGSRSKLAVPAGWTTLLVLLHGTVQVNGRDVVREGQFVLFDRAREDIVIEANNDVTALVLTGKPIDEPVVGHGPFVMNTADEIREAIRDFNSGRFGQLPA